MENSRVIKRLVQDGYTAELFVYTDTSNLIYGRVVTPLHKEYKTAHPFCTDKDLDRSVAQLLSIYKR